VLDDGLDGKVLAICFLWVVGSLLGLARLLLATPPRRVGWAAVLELSVATLLAGLAAGLWWSGQPAALWQAALILAAAYGGFLLIGSRLVGRLLTLTLTLCRNRRVQAVALLLGCPFLALWLSAGAVLPAKEEAPVCDFDEIAGNDDPLTFAAMLRPADSGPAFTDRGRPVAIATCDYQIVSMKAAEAGERSLFQAKGLDGRVLRTAPPDWSYNCHGWVFTGGRYWIRKPAEVEVILEDNGYCAVSQPEPGDLAVYRSRQGTIIHTGVVRTVEEEGLVLVESKWGTMGRYVHPSDAYPYDNVVCFYYRSPRPQHRLRDIP
jgi:hypothetical protein